MQKSAASESQGMGVTVSVGITAVGVCVEWRPVEVGADPVAVNVTVGRVWGAGTGVQEAKDSKIRQNAEACFIHGFLSLR